MYFGVARHQGFDTQITWSYYSIFMANSFCDWPVATTIPACKFHDATAQMMRTGVGFPSQKQRLQVHSEKNNQIDLRIEDLLDLCGFWLATWYPLWPSIQLGLKGLCWSTVAFGWRIFLQRVAMEMFRSYLMLHHRWWLALGLMAQRTCSGIYSIYTCTYLNLYFYIYIYSCL